MRRAQLFGVGVLTVALCLTVLLLTGRPSSAGGKSDGALLPPAEFAKLVTQDAKTIQDVLAKGLDKKGTRKVTAAAFMIAVYAQNSMTKGAANAKELATLRDTAVSLLKAVKGGDEKAATALAAKLTPTPKADGAVKLEPLALDKLVEFEDVMHQFSSERVGGYGLEKELGELAEEKELTPAHMERIAVLGYRLAMIGHASDAFSADKNEGGKKTIKNWQAHTANFRKVTVAMAEVAKTKNAANTRDALDRVNTSCVKCHDDFRP
jgi:hypothetical protein